MTTILERLKADQLQARRNKDTEADKAATLTSILGEIQRAATKVETDEAVTAAIRAFLKSQRKEIAERPFAGSDLILAELAWVETTYLPNNVLSQDQIRELVAQSGATDVKTLMPFLSKYEKEHKMIVDKAFARTLVEQK